MAQEIQTLEAIAIPKNGRALLVGKTGSGKSVLAEQLIRHWRRTQPHPRILIVDSKPRFRASHELNGMLANRRYKKWGYGAYVDRSVVLPAGVHVRHAMQQTWRLGFDTAIAQINNLSHTGWLEAAIGWFYEDADAGHQQLVYIDEAADFFGTSGTYGRGNSIVQAVRSGRERGVAVAASTQRPKGIPKSAITETSKLYLFKLAYRSDMDHLQEMGLPEEIMPPSRKHDFVHFDNDSEEWGVYRLRLEDN